MKEKIVLVDMGSMTTTASEYKEYCNRIIVKHNAIGVMLSNVSKEELNMKLKKGLYDITLEKSRYMIEELPRTVTIYVNIDRKILEYYLDGYKSIHIVKENNSSQIFLQGDIKEIEKLVAALSRNGIRAVRIKQN